jgi:hypothetical protein
MLSKGKGRKCEIDASYNITLLVHDVSPHRSTKRRGAYSSSDTSLNFAAFTPSMSCTPFLITGAFQAARILASMTPSMTYTIFCGPLWKFVATRPFTDLGVVIAIKGVINTASGWIKR